jgi:cell division protease FtsH
MVSQLKQYTADHRYLLEVIARHAGFTAPVAIELDEFYAPLMKVARKGELLPIDGVLVRDWDPDNRRLQPGIQLGMRLYKVEGIRFVRVRFAYTDQPNVWGLDFVAVDRKDYRRLYKTALRCRRDFEPAGKPPVLQGDQADILWKNTIGYLDPANLRRIKAYGGRPKRGVLLMGPPGNGKTTACRWIWEECRRRNWQWRLVTPDAYQQARHSCNPQEAVRELFSVEGRGIVFFDDMDLALRDRETVRETDDQAVFLGALDGISVQEGVVFVFTTNCAPELIDRAFKRPGRLDLVLHFQAPDAGMRRQLIARWHEDIRAHVDLDTMISSTEDYSFAEIEELKNLLIMHYLDADRWSWSWALEQFEVNRKELAHDQRRRVGFGQYHYEALIDVATNGNGK